MEATSLQRAQEALVVVPAAALAMMAALTPEMVEAMTAVFVAEE
tara:strand:- start:35716 stop:35847 length:132 start_codon:yes stop_codon:yes gene_type:complete